MTTYNLKIKTFDNLGKFMFRAIAIREEDGLQEIWVDSEYLEDAIRDLGKEIRRLEVN